MTPQAYYRKAFGNGFWTGIFLVTAFHPQKIAEWWGLGERTVSIICWVGVAIGVYLWTFVPEDWWGSERAGTPSKLTE